MSRRMPSFHCKSVSKAFNGHFAVQDLSLEMPAVGIVAIIGPNGAGKTTLLNLLTGFLRPDAGRCYCDRRDITRLPPHRIARLGIARTFQDLRLIRQVSTLDNVMLACPNQQGERLLQALLRIGVRRQESRNRDRAMEFLGLTGLEAEASRPAGELSYGQQKLLTIACCLATEPRVLLLDEPVAGVQPELAAHILGLLQQLRSDGKLIVFIEHDIAAVRRVADLVFVMDHGQLVTQGPPGEVLERPEIMEAYVG